MKILEVLVKASDCENESINFKFNKETFTYENDNVWHVTQEMQTLVNTFIDWCECSLTSADPNEFDYFLQSLVETIFYYVQQVYFGEHVYFNNIKYYLTIDPEL